MHMKEKEAEISVRDRSIVANVGVVVATSDMNKYGVPAPQYSTIAHLQ